MECRVVLGFGSNNGDSLSILKQAVNDFSPMLKDLRVSSLYLTKAQDVIDQPDFCNLAVCGGYDGTPQQLLEYIHVVEARYGRNRSREIPKGPRTLDIDIILFGNECVRNPDLVIPHERMQYRQFVLVPLLELLPDSADPFTGELYRKHLERLPDQGVKKVGNLYGN